MDGVTCTFTTLLVSIQGPLVIMRRYQVVTASAGGPYLFAVALLMFFQLTLSVLCCHWKVKVELPPLTEPAVCRSVSGTAFWQINCGMDIALFTILGLTVTCFSIESLQPLSLVAR